MHYIYYIIDAMIDAICLVYRVLGNGLYTPGLRMSTDHRHLVACLRKNENKAEKQAQLPAMPSIVDGDVFNERNLDILKEEAIKIKPSN